MFNTPLLTLLLLSSATWCSCFSPSTHHQTHTDFVTSIKMVSNTETTPMPILGYWKIRGLASSIRYQLVYSSVDFEEEVYEQGDGPGFSVDSWYDVKFDQGLTYPNLPYLKDGEDVKFTESGAIHRYCAKKWCPELLCFDDDKLYAKAEMVWGVVSDLKGFVTGTCYSPDGDKKALSDAALPRFERLAAELKNNKFLIGDRLCCADFAFVELLEMMDFISDGKLYSDVYPSLKEYRDRMFGLPKLKEYYEDEKKCPKLPFNNKSAKINSM